MSLQVHVMVLGTVERTGKPIVYGHDEKVFWLIKTFFLWHCYDPPTFHFDFRAYCHLNILSLLLYMSDPRPCHFLLAHVSSNEVSMRGAVPPTESLQQIRRGRSCCFLDRNRAWGLNPRSFPSES